MDNGFNWWFIELDESVLCCVVLCEIERDINKGKGSLK